MKNTLLVFALMLWSSFSYTQIIDIPDADFKNALINSNCAKFDCNSNVFIDVDTNNDGEIQLTEAEAVCELKIRSLSNAIQRIEGINKFKNLVKLDCSYIMLNQLDVSNLIQLRSIIAENNLLVDIKLSNLPSLDSIGIRVNKIKNINFNDFPNLRYFSCEGNQMEKFNLINAPNISFLDVHANRLTELNVSQFKKLESLMSMSNLINEINLNNNPKLQFLNLNNNPLETILIKNGENKVVEFLSIPSSVKYICTDEKHFNYFKSSYPDAEINSYCNFIPGGKFYIISGKSKLNDGNTDCKTSNYPISKIKYTVINESNKINYYPSLAGQYYIPVQEGTNTIKAILENPDNFTVSPDSITVTFPSTSDTIIQDFCIMPRNILRQTDLSIIPLTPPARPGFDAQYKIVMTNKGNQVENGILYFSYDEAKMDFVSTDINPSTQGDGLLSWNFTDLLPFETRYYNVTLNVNSPSENPPVKAGDELLITCNILDNVFLLKQEVVGSYDPNDKTCLEGKTITPEKVGEYVHYLIRFENTGNYAAENVVVKDVIDEKTFDISTLQITDASHETRARINGNIVEFIFENIQLPFDDASNDGYICFKIKTKPTLILGNELKNEANIYFDYNIPILTNKTNTVVANLVGTDEVIGESDIEIFPNPVSDVLKFSSNDKIFKVEIFDMSGRLVQVSSVVEGEVNVKGLLSGAYEMKVFTQLGVRNVKMVKI